MLRLFRALSHLPLGLLQALGALLGLAVYAASPTYRKRLRANLAQAGYAPSRLALDVARGTGRMLGEMPYVWFRFGPSAAVRRVQLVGKEHVEQAKRESRGILFLTPHLGCFEASAQVVSEWLPITVLYRPPRKRWLDSLVQARPRGQLRTAPATVTGMRPLLRALRHGEAVGLLPDQAPGAGEGVWAPFFGRPAYTMTLPARLVQLTGARIILAFAERLPRGQGYVLHFLPFDETLPDDPVEAATRINLAVEGLIRMRPEQYLWGYNRYKAPPGSLPMPSAQSGQAAQPGAAS
ncbi:Lipid A biosynthesis acyltransferase [Thiomonas sp. X19]|uniref:lysophospholipid acyltransferase family protein n=1 Tax=Thiomonas sp. X19 TaxID=1050370 RepID=UPI000B6B0972|nr:lysophospholipid acyltransferase family protein [Thiomonas sp. X19]SCC95533.1 Lipid A biosynthesis acyltransferase [Thiomonas sp. X19]